LVTEAGETERVPSAAQAMHRTETEALLRVLGPDFCALCDPPVFSSVVTEPLKPAGLGHPA
jgi:hypothetical protein